MKVVVAGRNCSMGSNLAGDCARAVRRAGGDPGGQGGQVQDDGEGREGAQVYAGVHEDDSGVRVTQIDIFREATG
jgi:hypothetical protein